METKHSAFIFAASLILTACGVANKVPEEKETIRQNVVQLDGLKSAASTPGTTPLQSHPTPGHGNAQPLNSLDEVAPFVPAGARVLAVSSGDINEDGLQDAVLVIDRQTGGNGVSAATRSRAVLLLMRGKDQRLRSAGENDKIVPCKECGGMLGDPFVDVSAGRGTVTFMNEGGSGTLWSDEYAFKFSTGRLLLNTVKRSMADRSTNETKEIQLTARNFGVIEFDEFDPATLPTIDFP